MCAPTNNIMNKTNTRNLAACSLALWFVGCQTKCWLWREWSEQSRRGKKHVDEANINNNIFCYLFCSRRTYAMSDRAAAGKKQSKPKWNTKHRTNGKEKEKYDDIYVSERTDGGRWAFSVIFVLVFIVCWMSVRLALEHIHIAYVSARMTLESAHNYVDDDDNDDDDELGRNCSNYTQLRNSKSAGDSHRFSERYKQKKNGKNWQREGERERKWQNEINGINCEEKPSKM